MIFNIQRFSLHDGAGIRTLVFFKGCPLRCSWCSNPESQAFTPEFFFDAAKCIGCRDCADNSAAGEVAWTGAPAIDRSARFDAGRFRRLCPAEALTVAGEEKSVDAILAEVDKDRLFYRGGGGLTLSGGEPFAQPEFAAELLAGAKRRGLATAAETCLAVRWNAIEPSLPFLDAVYADVKHVDPAAFRRATGGDLDLVTENLRRLARHGPPLAARVPVIPGFNADAEVLDAIAAFVASLGSVKTLHLMPFHSFGEGKYALLGRRYHHAGTPSMRPEELTEVAEALRRHGMEIRIGG